MKAIFKYITLIIYGTLVLYLANKFIELNNLTKNFYYGSIVLFLLITGYTLIQKFFMGKEEK
ncbi:MAG: hypothetical protein KHZ99_18560 [Clostridium sp.]|uniref:hypothetical protein n=1 Tax=Clostridium TaxID=1485 RepID=UPI00115B0330|nr:MULTISPECIES: hypothetical protein [Clostridium]MBS4959006.1 hypothetical protein [Clostridium sp.]MDU1568298.1 hypothetical protein [Clostridium sp.]MDU2155925.1 hypothetical protein [Clostridium sp.]